MADPRPDSVEAVVFLVGDAGGADGVGNPVLEKLTWEVEHWSQSLARESAVTVIFLGDNVYPSGYHDVSDDDHPRDSVRLGNQLAVVSGPQAKTYGTRGIFIPGNHGWANTSGAVAMSRLDNLQARIDRERVRGPEVHVMPAAGLTGPEYVDLGERIRIILLDTQWWLAEGTREPRLVEANERLADLHQGRPRHGPRRGSSRVHAPGFRAGRWRGPLRDRGTTGIHRMSRGRNARSRMPDNLAQGLPPDLL